MIYFDVGQGTSEWHHLRLGVATASCFDQIVTAKKGEPSKSMSGYINRLLAELVTGTPTEIPKTYWMERGALMEVEARTSYQMITGHEIDRGGFITNDDMTIGASPDLRIFIDGKAVGCAEIKCPSPTQHIENLRMAASGKVNSDYYAQVQGQILLGGFEFNDWFSYHPDMPPAYIRTYRDDEYCQKLQAGLDIFMQEMNKAIDDLRRIGVLIPDRPIIGIHRSMTDYKTEQIPDFLTSAG